MPDETIVESCRVAIVRSSALTFLKRARMSPALACFCSSMSVTIRPFARSCAATACLFSASISPFAPTPAISRALNANVPMAMRP